MHLSGWIIMAVSVGSVIMLVGFCLCKVLSLPPVEDEPFVRRKEEG